MNKRKEMQYLFGVSKIQEQLRRSESKLARAEYYSTRSYDMYRKYEADIRHHEAMIEKYKQRIEDYNTK